MNRIQELRKEKKLKQAELAELVPTSRQAIGKWESGTIDLSTPVIARLCQIFGVTADYLLGFSSQRTTQISDEDAALVAAYHAADEDARSIVDLALKPYFAETKMPEAAG